MKMDYHKFLIITATISLIIACNSILKKDSQTKTQNKNTMKETQKMQQVISEDGTVISYLKSGTGLPLLFVHGTTADHRSWIILSPHLEHHHAVYALDRRGRGASGDSPDYELMREAEDIVAVVEAIGEPVSLFGHSFGGLCCLEATLLTNKISHLILYEPLIPTGTPSFPLGVVDRIQAQVEHGELEAAMELFLRDVAKIPDHELEAYRQKPLWKARIPLAPTIPREMSIEMTYRFNAEKFAGFQVPAMLLLGGDSPEIYQKSIEIIDSALPNSKVVILPGQQHMAHHMNPELLAKEVLQFLLE
jgi:pimeloyl-ACP methyl ester carboxylesterase